MMRAIFFSVVLCFSICVIAQNSNGQKTNKRNQSYTAGEASTRKLNTAIDTSKLKLQIPGDMLEYYPILQSAMPQLNDTLNVRLYNVATKKIENIFQNDSSTVVMTAAGLSCDIATYMVDSLIHLKHTFPGLSFAIVLLAEAHPNGYACPYGLVVGHESYYEPPNQMSFTMKQRVENAIAYKSILFPDADIKLYVDDAANSFTNNLRIGPCALLMTDKRGVVQLGHALFNFGGNRTKLPVYGRPVAEHQIKAILIAK